MNTKRNRTALKDVLEKEMKDTSFRLYFERERAISEIARLVRDSRQLANLTQEQLAVRAKTNQSVIARLESGEDERIPSLELLERIASALRAKLMVSFEYKKAA